jgi:hypothetical protein
LSERFWLSRVSELSSTFSLSLSLTLSHQTKALAPPNPRSDDLARYSEAKLGKATNAINTDKLKQFMENDRKVSQRGGLCWGRHGLARKPAFVCFRGSSKQEPRSGLAPRTRVPLVEGDGGFDCVHPSVVSAVGSRGLFMRMNVGCWDCVLLL